jgi:hypothetical protein
MEIKGKPMRPIIIIIALFILSNPCFSVSGEEPADSSQRSNGSQGLDVNWQLEKGWTVTQGALVGKDLSRASYGELCAEGPLTFKFNLKDLQGGLHVNINENATDKYIIGLVNIGNGTLSTYLIKQMGTFNPVTAETLSGQSIIYKPSIEHQIEIRSEEDRIRVFLSEVGANSAATVTLIDYHDPNPLPPGGVSFETQENSMVSVDSIEVTCPLSSPEEEATPSLGLGYFKRPT